MARLPCRYTWSRRTKYGKSNPDYLKYMAELKTREHDGDVAHFIRSHADTEQKLDDSFALLELMREATGYEPKMWGDSIIGFGKYHYKSEDRKSTRLNSSHVRISYA